MWPYLGIGGICSVGDNNNKRTCSFLCCSLCVILIENTFITMGNKSSITVYVEINIFSCLFQNTF